MSWTDDPLRDFYRWDAEQAEKEEQLPECDRCGEKIREEYAYKVDDELICETCIKSMRVFV